MIDCSKLRKQMKLFFLPFEELKKNHNKYVSSKIGYSTFKLRHKSKSSNEINLPFQHTNGLAQEVHEVHTVRGPQRKLSFLLCTFYYEKLHGFIVFQNNPKIIIISSLDFKWHFREKRDEEVVCYGDVGCFRDDGPFDYLDMLPSTPEEVGTNRKQWTHNKFEIRKWTNTKKIILQHRHLVLFVIKFKTRETKNSCDGQN